MAEAGLGPNLNKTKVYERRKKGKSELDRGQKEGEPWPLESQITLSHVFCVCSSIVFPPLTDISSY